MPERMLFVRSPAVNEYIGHVNDNDQVWLEPDGDNYVVRIAGPDEPIPSFAEVAYLNQHIKNLDFGMKLLRAPGRVARYERHKRGRRWSLYEVRETGELRELHMDLNRRQAKRLLEALEAGHARESAARGR